MRTSDHRTGGSQDWCLRLNDRPHDDSSAGPVFAVEQLTTELLVRRTGVFAA